MSNEAVIASEAWQSSVDRHGLRPRDDDVRRPIGVFDSGIGGLSILRALRAELPLEDFVYVSDAGHAPYGERDERHVVERSRAITTYLRAEHGIKALVIACNTATAAAIHLLRDEHPGLPIIGVEPALKPAIALSQTRRIGVMATRGTLASAKFHVLLNSLARQADFVCQPCDGLADAIERADTTKIVALCSYFTGAMGRFGLKYDEIDTLVLGCTHYPFASHDLVQLVGPDVHLIDNGEAVARQTHRILAAVAHLVSLPDGTGRCQLFDTGDGVRLQQAAHHWLGIDSPVCPLQA